MTGMYVSHHKACRLRRKMTLVHGVNKSGKVHSLINRRLYEMHSEDFKTYSRVQSIWLDPDRALIAYN